MTARFSREYGAHLHVAQEARRDGSNVSFDVPVRQPGKLTTSGEIAGEVCSLDAAGAEPRARIEHRQMHTAHSSGPLTLSTGPATPSHTAQDRLPVRDPGSGASIPTITDAVYERDVLRVVLVALRLHPRVAWVERMNSGKFKLAGKDGKPQWVRFGFKGMADVTGQLKDGRRLECECKRPGEQPTPEQASFLANVRAAGGVAFVAHGVDDVMRELR